ncbi:MAG: hypothetical protein AB4368_23455 [Xenococcaceae cyanobacterium]
MKKPPFLGCIFLFGYWCMASLSIRHKLTTSYDREEFRICRCSKSQEFFAFPTLETSEFLVKES